MACASLEEEVLLEEDGVVVVTVEAVLALTSLSSMCLGTLVRVGRSSSVI